MADAMKMVPVEPTEEMVEAAVRGIELAQKQGWYGLSPVAIYRAMLAASPPAREEAPGEWAGEYDGDPELPDTPEARTIFKHFCDVHGLHPDEAADSTGELLDALSALRARTLDKPFACIERATYDKFRSGPQGVAYGGVRLTMPGLALKAQQMVTLYTHPAPATADKLKVAKEALEKIANRRSIVFGRGEMSGQEAFGIATDALATLNEEG